MKNKFLTTLILSFFLFSNLAYALPTITSEDSQTFDQNSPPTQLKNITIVEDSMTSYIKQGSIKITIPDSIKMLFDPLRTQQNILLYGTAVDSGKVKANPTVSFEAKDKTLVIPVDADFALNDTLVITKAYVEGFHVQAAASTNLVLSVNDEVTTLDAKTVFVRTSSLSDTQSPEPPTNVTVGDFEKAVKITWTDPTDLDLNHVRILKGKNNLPVDASTYIPVSAGIQEYVDTDVKAGETVKYILRATDGRNFSTDTTEISFVVGSSPVVVEEPDDETPVEEGETEEEPETEEPEETVEEEPTFCTLEYAPVCGADGVTYSNACAAEKNNIAIDYVGECIEPEPEKIEFSDLVEHWSKEKVETMAQAGVVKGNSDGSFNPDGKLNRAEAAALIYRIKANSADEPLVPEEKPFPDIETTAWYAGYVHDLKIAAIIAGNPDGTYKPENTVNRAEFLTLAVNLYYSLANEEDKQTVDKLRDGALTRKYADLEDDWYAGNVTFAAEIGFIEGRDCGTSKCFYAEDTITRAEAATILYNMFL